jgi:hypothetical protein
MPSSSVRPDVRAFFEEFEQAVAQSEPGHALPGPGVDDRGQDGVDRRRRAAADLVARPAKPPAGGQSGNGGAVLLALARLGRRAGLLGGELQEIDGPPEGLADRVAGELGLVRPVPRHFPFLAAQRKRVQ